MLPNFEIWPINCFCRNSILYIITNKNLWQIIEENFWTEVLFSTISTIFLWIVFNIENVTSEELSFFLQSRRWFFPLSVTNIFRNSEMATVKRHSLFAIVKWRFVLLLTSARRKFVLHKTYFLGYCYQKLGPSTITFTLFDLQTVVN